MPEISEIDDLQAEILKTLDDPDLKEKTKHFPKFDLETMEEELKTHPFFMSKDTPMPTSEQIENSDLLQGLQAMKYDRETAYEKAAELKTDGNEHFKLKLYKKAIAAYSEGLNLRVTELPQDPEPNDVSPNKLNAILSCNRATCQFYLKNYRSSIQDCAISTKFEPTHEKAYIRACKCLEKLKKYSEQSKWAKKGLAAIPNSTELR